MRRGNWVACFAVLAMASLGGCNDPTTTDEQQLNTVYSIGQSVPTEYFDVTVNKVSETSTVNPDPRVYEATPAGLGNKFLVLDVTIKNTDTEGRLFLQGELIANQEGKEYIFDSPESILADGYLSLDTLNPMTTLSGKVVFKVPSDLHGDLYWVPGRDDKRISLQNANSRQNSARETAAEELGAAPEPSSAETRVVSEKKEASYREMGAGWQYVCRSNPNGIAALNEDGVTRKELDADQVTSICACVEKAEPGNVESVLSAPPSDITVLGNGGYSSQVTAFVQCYDREMQTSKDQDQAFDSSASNP